jgi:hypothetical protein
VAASARGANGNCTQDQQGSRQAADEGLIGTRLQRAIDPAKKHRSAPKLFDKDSAQESWRSALAWDF